MRALPLVVLFLLIAMSPANHAQRPAPDLSPGVPESLAVERSSRVSALPHRIALRIPPKRSHRSSATSTITFTLSDPGAPLALDFEPNAMGAVRRLSVAGVAVNADLRNGHLILPASSLRSGNNVVTIEFDAGDAPLNRNDDFLYTIFVPARAHEAFPCFDQPDLKARWTLELTVPDTWETLANGAETARSSSSGRKHVTFAETEPISTYLFAFAAGKFSVEEAQRNGRTFRMVHRETDAGKGARDREALFDLHAAALSWLEQYTGIPYPFGKFDFFLVPAFQFGGMEHPGAVFYNASGMMLDESATQNQLLERASTISHETSHMWFGDLVTMRWFTDVWMKEVFANFMAAKIVNPSFPGVNHELRFLHAYYPLAYDVDRTGGSNAIRQPLDNLKNAGTLYGAIIYQKAPIVMRQLETIMGADAFREGLREYLRQHQFGNASWTDLIAVLDTRTPEDLATWSHAWVEEEGRPILATELALADGKIERLAFTTSDPQPRRGLTWTQDIQVALGYADRIQVVPVHVAGSRTEVPAARGLPAPLFVLPNGGGIAYGDLRLDRQTLLWLAQHLPEIPDALTRGAAWISLWESMLNAEISAERVIDLAIAALPREDDELNVQRILSYLEQANWKFVSESTRTSRATVIEETLKTGLARASTPSLKSAYFSALRDVAITPPTLGWLTRVWSGEESIPGLTLAETDFIALSQELAVREVPGWRTLLQQQIDRTQNPDRKARLQFVAPALSSDQSERDRFFASLADVQNRSHEPWVLDGLRYLHHPLRAQSSIKYIAPSLRMLQEIQRTGDIFFPKRWMDWTLSGHRSREAARLVRSFIDQQQASYPDRLRRIILSSADDLFRASDERVRQ